MRKDLLVVRVAGGMVFDSNEERADWFEGNFVE